VRILVTAWRLIDFTGADLYTRDLAVALSRRGHEVVVYTPFPGQIADRIRSVAVPVVSDLRTLMFDPQIIHGQHRPALLAALKRYPATPAISLMHGATAAIDAPVPLSRIRRYVAVDDVCRARLTRELWVPQERTRVILNFADLNRFAPRAPLPASPRRALVFSNYADRSTHLPALTEACRRAGLPLDVAGGGVGRTVEEPGPLLAGYDLVFAKARCAIEAMAVGTAVVLCDFPGLGPMVTTANFSRLRPLNFGATVLTAPLNSDAIGDAIRGYDAADAAAVSARTREEADMEKAIDAWVDLYQEVLDEPGYAVVDSPAEAAMLDAAIRHSRTFFKREALTGRLRRVQSLPLVGGGLYAQLHRLRRALTKPAS
jgi:glycosyltransferase involved in cell wall biosynthesis